MDHALSYDGSIGDEMVQTLQQPPLGAQHLTGVMAIGVNNDNDVIQHHENDDQADVIVTSASGNLNTSTKDPLNSAKRRRSVLTLQQKLDIIARLKSGEKMTKLAVEYGVGKATLSDIKKQEDKITAFLAKMQTQAPASTNNSQRRKTMRRPQDELVERALFLWLTRERQKGVQITGTVLMEKARDFHRQLYGKEGADKFKASTGWLHRFKQRNGVRSKRVIKPKAAPGAEDGDAQLIEAQLTRLRALVQDECLGPEQIYSVVKARLHWRALPGTGTDSSKDATSLRPSSRDCVVVVGCANATGSHKLRLTLVSRHRPPWPNHNSDRMPFRYYATGTASSSDGRMDRELFGQWFSDEFAPAVRAYHGGSGLTTAGALLLVDGGSNLVVDGTHDALLEDGRIRCVALPAVAAFLTQPVNYFTFESVKRAYRRELIARVLVVRPRNKRLPTQLSELGSRLTTKEAGYMLSEAWRGVSGESVRRLWRDTLYCLGAVDEQAVVVDELLQKVDQRNGGNLDGNGGGDPHSLLADDVCDIVGMLRDNYGGVSEAEVANWLTIDSEDAERRTSDLEIIEAVLASSESENEEEEGQKEIEVSCGQVAPLLANGRSVRLSASGSGGGCGSNELVASPVTAPSDAEAFAAFTKCLAWLEVQPDCEAEHLQLLWRLQGRAAQRRKWNS